MCCFPSSQARNSCIVFFLVSCLLVPVAGGVSILRERSSFSDYQPFFWLHLGSHMVYFAIYPVGGYFMARKIPIRWITEIWNIGIWAFGAWTAVEVIEVRRLVVW